MKQAVKKGITLFKIPYQNDEQSEAKFRKRKLWINFMTRICDKWRPTENSSICCAHFIEDNFLQRFSLLPGMSGSSGADGYILFCGPMFLPAFVLSQPNFKMK